MWRVAAVSGRLVHFLGGCTHQTVIRSPLLSVVVVRCAYTQVSVFSCHCSAMSEARRLPLLLLVMLASLQLSLAATRRRQIEDLSSEVEEVGEGEGAEDKAVEVSEDEVETVTFNGHGNGEEDFWDHVMDNSTDIEREDVPGEKETGELEEDNEGKGYN